MHRLRTLLLVPTLFFLAPSPAAATTTSNLPWEGILITLRDSFTGTIAAAAVTIAIVVAGIYWAFSNDHRGVVNLVKAVIVAGIITGIGALLSAFGISLATV